MGQQLKGVIFGWDNVLVATGNLTPQIPVLNEIGRLVRYLKSRGVEIVVVTNRNCDIVDGKTGARTPYKDYFGKAWGVEIEWHLCGQNGGAGKQSKEAMNRVLADKGWRPNETVFIGNSETDMQASVNSKILLLIARWYPDNENTTEYGFPFDEPKQIARFLDVFCLRDHVWAYKVEDAPLSVYTLATFSTMYEPFIEYSNDFYTNIKQAYGHDDEFWAKYLCSGLYLSGIYADINYITSYPCHSKGDFPEILIEPMTRFAKCFRKNYIPDLLVRHTTATKSQTNRNTVDHLNQLQTIHLNANPTKRGNEKYANSPLAKGKTVLVIDDVCSKGMSFEAARQYIAATGCNVISVALLKALRHSYERLQPVALSPYRPNKPTNVIIDKTYSYSGHILSDTAAKQLRDRLRRYKSWDWPSGI